MFHHFHHLIEIRFNEDEIYAYWDDMHYEFEELVQIVDTRKIKVVGKPTQDAFTKFLRVFQPTVLSIKNEWLGWLVDVPFLTCLQVRDGTVDSSLLPKSVEVLECFEIDRCPPQIHTLSTSYIPLGCEGVVCLDVLHLNKAPLPSVKHLMIGILDEDASFSGLETLIVKASLKPFSLLTPINYLKTTQLPRSHQGIKKFWYTFPIPEEFHDQLFIEYEVETLITGREGDYPRRVTTKPTLESLSY